MNTEFEVWKGQSTQPLWPVALGLTASLLAAFVIIRFGPVRSPPPPPDPAMFDSPGPAAPMTPTENDLRHIVSAGEAWSKSHRGECPTIVKLVSEGAFPPRTSSVDEFGTPYSLSCPQPGVIVGASAEADRMWNTPDDTKMTVAEANNLNVNFPY